MGTGQSLQLCVCTFVFVFMFLCLYLHFVMCICICICVFLVNDDADEYSQEAQRVGWTGSQSKFAFVLLYL